MKLLRIHPGDGSEPLFGIEEEGRVYEIGGDPLGSWTVERELGKLGGVRLAPPCRPGKVIALAANYPGSTGCGTGEEEPFVFLKSGTSVTGPDGPIVCGFPEGRVWGEPELAVVIGRRLERASEEEAREGILGYTVANDVTVENVEGRDHHLARSKAADTFCPLGPVIDTEFTPGEQIVTGWQNGDLLREGSVGARLWDDVRVVRWLSRWTTLEPWDVILTGTPPRVRDRLYLEDGDEFVCEVEGLGRLTSRFLRARGEG